MLYNVVFTLCVCWEGSLDDSNIMMSGKFCAVTDARPASGATLTCTSSEVLNFNIVILFYFFKFFYLDWGYRISN